MNEQDFRIGIRAVQLPDHPDFHLHVGIKVCSDEDMLAEQDGHILLYMRKKLARG